MAPARHLPDQAFPFLSTSECDRLLPYGREQRFDTGQAIVEEGHYSSAIYVLLSGRVAVEKEHLGASVTLDELRPGAVFGEISFLERSPASASVVASEPVELFVLADLDELLGSDPALAAGFYRSLSTLLARRLRFATKESARAAAFV